MLFVIYYTNCDSVMNKKDELQVEIELYKPGLVVLTEIFPKGIKSTEIMDQELKICGFNLMLGKVTEKCSSVSPSPKKGHGKVLKKRALSARGDVLGGPFKRAGQHFMHQSFVSTAPHLRGWEGIMTFHFSEPWYKPCPVGTS